MFYQEHPVPGQYKLTFDDYLKLNAVSRSDLSELRKSPAHAQYARANHRASTPAMEFGEAFHCALLEPERFAAEYIVAPNIKRNTKEGKAAYAEWAEKNGHLKAIDEEERDKIDCMLASVRQLKVGETLLSRIAETESTLIWRDLGTDLICKGRIDADAPLLKTLIDVKTTQSAERAEFERSIFNYGYHRQAAFYLDGMNAIGFDRTDYVIIAIEKTAPFACALYRLADDVIELGRRENAELLRRWKLCEIENNWPAYPDKVQDISIPAWAKKQIEQNLEY